MKLIAILLFLLKFCSGKISWYYDDSGRTTICHGSTPCEFNITKDFPLSPKIPRKYIYFNYIPLFATVYGYFLQFHIPENQVQNSFYIEAYDASNGENIIKGGDCFYINTSEYDVSQDNLKYTFIFTDIDNITFIRFRFFGLSEGFSMKVKLQLDSTIDFYEEVFHGRDTVLCYYRDNESLSKNDIENLEENSEEYKKKMDEQKEYIQFAKEIIKNTTLQLFYSNIDINSLGDDIFDSTVLYLGHYKITISYLVGAKYSSSNYYEPSITLFDSKIANGKISINWGAYDYFNKKVTISNRFLDLYNMFQNYIINIAFKLVISNDNFYFTVMYENGCLKLNFRFFFKGEFGPFAEVQMIICYRDIEHDDILKAGFDKIKNSIKDFWDNLDPEWKPFVEGICIGVLIGLTPVGVAVGTGLDAAYGAVAGLGNVVITKITVAGTAAANWLSNVLEIDFQLFKDKASEFTSGLATEFSELTSQIRMNFYQSFSPILTQSYNIAKK